MAHAVMTISFSICQFCVGLLLFRPISVVEGAALGLQKCPKGSFFDDVLQKCENCYAVCIDAVLQRTEDKCALCEDRIPPKPSEDSHASSPEATSILVVALVIGIIVLMIVMIVIIAIVNRQPLHRMCQRLQARLSLQDIRGNEEIVEVQDDTTEDEDDNRVRGHLHAATVLIESPHHDPQNVLDYQQQKEFDLKLARSGQKNVLTGSFAAHQITLLVCEDVQETLLKSMN